MKIILASKSPRRKEILENLGVEFEIIVSEANEDSNEKDPSRLVKELSLRKGRAVIESIKNEGDFKDEDVYVISSDTVVATAGENAEILGKPKDIEDAKRMLGLLEGKSHFVHSGIAVTKLSKNGEIKEAADTESTRVEFLSMTEEEIDFYVKNESVLDKAGAYAVQGFFGRYIQGLKGSYANVMGLPISMVYQEMKKL